MRRASIWLALVIVLTGTSMVPPPAEAAVGSSWVTWTVDHTKRTITVAAKLQIYLGPCITFVSAPDGAEGGPGSTGRDCSATAAQIGEAIKADIESVWNGHTYKCYRLIFKVDVTVTSDRFHVDPNRVGIRIDRSTGSIRSYVEPTWGSKVELLTSNNWKGTEPRDRVEVDNGLLHPSTWEYPASGTHMYAHEFGHVLGLHDQYVEGTWQPKPGAPSDIMWSTGTDSVAQDTINKVVERNRDRLKDTKGRQVDLDDFVCERQFRATLVARDRHYGATHYMNSARECPSPATTSSTDQALRVDSDYSDLNLIEDPAAGALGYRLSPVFDVLMLQNGMSITGRRNTEIGLFDLPVTVDVQRDNSTPASGDVPPLLDHANHACAGGAGSPPPSDCGHREYKSWMAMLLTGADEIWPMASVLPATLVGIGTFDGRLYRTCSGPRPWPGDFARDGGGAAVTRGKLPSLQEITKVAEDWFQDGIAGKIEIDGTATLNETRPGSLTANRYAWTLTLCPLDRDGNPPPGCR